MTKAAPKKKVPSPTGKPSTVKPAVKKFMAGKKSGGKRTSAYSAPPKPKPKPKAPGGLISQAAANIARNKRKKKKAAD